MGASSTSLPTSRWPWRAAPSGEQRPGNALALSEGGLGRWEREVWGGGEWRRGGFYRPSGRVWAVATANGGARWWCWPMQGRGPTSWAVGGVTYGVLASARGRHRRGKREGSSGRGLPGCVFRVLGFGVVGFKWAWGLVVFGEEERVQGGGFGWLLGQDDVQGLWWCKAQGPAMFK
jgi:hypothetical protein